jgi:predicted porin
MVSGTTGRFDYAAEITNASLSSPPAQWDILNRGFSNPTFSGRLGYRPNASWNIGFSASEGAYLESQAQSSLPPGRSLGDYREIVLAQDISFAWHHLQLWAEVFETRFQVPRIGNADTLAYYLEGKYKLTPQLFAALRWNQQFFGTIPDDIGGRVPWGRDIRRLDAGIGYRFSAHTQLKLQYSIQHERSDVSSHNHLCAAQFTARF